MLSLEPVLMKTYMVIAWRQHGQIQGVGMVALLPLLTLGQSATTSSDNVLTTIAGNGSVIFNLFITGRTWFKNSTSERDSVTYHTNLNVKNRDDTLHGGRKGWDYRSWTMEPHTNDSIIFSLVDPNGSEGMGLPGEAIAYVAHNSRRTNGNG
ncbi:hypothetical protein LTR49_027451 [Elasticomyces elasticus]|nr:hypothetical protein LTR49_027451 [Elasticomyces elasticus]